MRWNKNEVKSRQSTAYSRRAVLQSYCIKDFFLTLLINSARYSNGGGVRATSSNVNISGNTTFEEGVGGSRCRLSLTFILYSGSRVLNWKQSWTLTTPQSIDIGLSCYFLFAACALFLVFAFNITGNDSCNLLAISSNCFWDFHMVCFVWKSLQSWCMNGLELSFILNLGICAAANYHMKLSGGSQGAAYTSVGIAFLNFLGIVTYPHLHANQIKSAVVQRVHQLQHKNEKCYGKCEDEYNQGNLEHPYRVIPNKIVTCTEVNCDLHSIWLMPSRLLPDYCWMD